MNTDKISSTQKEELFNLSTEADALLDRTHFWHPPVPSSQSQKQSLNSSLRIGAIVGDRLYEGLRFEGELFLPVIMIKRSNI